MSSSIPVIYIVSPPFSGSTLLTYLLASHPAIGTIGERKKYYAKMLSARSKGSQECSCGLPFTDCPFWSRVQQRMSEGVADELIEFDFSAFHFSKNSLANRVLKRLFWKKYVAGSDSGLGRWLDRRFSQVVDTNRKLIEVILEISQSTVFLDSSKGFKHAYFLRTNPLLTVYPVLLFRDGRGQTFSTIRRGYAEGMRDAASKWKANIDQIDEMSSKWFERGIIKLNYENVCADPLQAVNRVFSMCGLNPVEEEPKLFTQSEHIMGNPMRLAAHTKIVDRQEWRKQLTRQDLETFDRIAGITNRRLGYSQ